MWAKPWGMLIDDLIPVPFFVLIRSAGLFIYQNLRVAPVKNRTAARCERAAR